MQNINKLKYDCQNLSKPFKFTSQKNGFSSKLISNKNGIKQKLFVPAKENKKVKILNDEYYSKNPNAASKQSIQNNHAKICRKTYLRSTVPFNISSLVSASNQKITQKNSKSSLKFIKNSFKNHSTVSKIVSDQIKKLNSQINKKTKVNTGAMQKIKQINRSQNNLQNLKRQIHGKKSKSTKKSFKKEKILQMKPVKKVSLQRVIKSSCITRNISKNNSKQKQYKNTVKQLNLKFKKKNALLKEGLQKKAKVSHVYSSMKISPRSSFKFIQTKSNEFLILNDYEQKNPEKQKQQNQVKNNCSKIEIKKVKSQKNIYEKLKQYVDSKDGSFIETKNKKDFFKKDKQFSFLQFIPLEKAKKENQNQTSIDCFLQNTDQQINFNLECQEPQNQMLNIRNQGSLQSLKQREYCSLEKLQQLSIYQNQYFNERSYSTNSELFKIAQQSQFDFKNISFDRNSATFMQRAQILDWLSLLSSQLLLKTQTYHLASAYYDIYFFILQSELQNKGQTCDSKSLHQLKLTGLGCLILAIKMDEREYQFDIHYAIMSLEPTFFKKDIIRAEFQILKKLRLKLKVQTLSFWLDYFSLKWDQFILRNSNQFKQMDKFLLKSVDGRSYENYRKITSIINSILLDGGIFNHSMIEIVLSTFYSVFSEIILQQSTQFVLQQINCLKQNAKSQIFDEKSLLENYPTQDTLDQLSNNDFKENFSQNITKNNLQNGSFGKKKLNQNQNTFRKQFLESNLCELKESFSQFVLNTTKKSFTQSEDTIKYVQMFLQIKTDFQMDQRVYDEARNYEEFIRYHSHLPFTKVFVMEKYFKPNLLFQEQSQKINEKQTPNLINSSFSQRNYFMEMKSNNLSQLLFQKVQKVFSNIQKITSS